jgi:hypothetical protein
VSGDGNGPSPPGDAAAATIAAATAKLRGWRDLPRSVVMSVFKKGNFAGVADMEANPRLFDRVAPIGVADILMAVSYAGPPAGARPRLGGPRSGLHSVLAFEGGRDGTIAPGAVAQWARFVNTSGGDGESEGGPSGGERSPPTAATSFRLVPLPEGDHYFVASRRREVTAVLSSALLDAVEARLPGGLLGEGHSWVEGA